MPARKKTPARKVSPKRKIASRVKSDNEAKKSDEALPAYLPPQLATRVREVPVGEGWLHEIKYDGYRILARKAGAKVTLFTRSRQDWTAKFPTVAAALARLGDFNCWFDGELCAVLPDGRTSFQGLQNTGKDPAPAIAYFIFDLLHLDGKNLRRLPLVERKELLQKVIGRLKRGPLRYGDYQKGDGELLYQEACKHHLEGIIAKRVDGVYRAARGYDWLKIKCDERQEFVIGGFKKYKGTMPQVGALLVGIYDKHGNLKYSGKVGTGFNDSTRRELFRRLKPKRTAEPAFANPPREKDVIWVEPSEVAEVAFLEWTKDEVLRHPVFQGLREDKNPLEIKRERNST